MLDKDQNAYAALDAPKTIHEMLDWAADEYGIDVPLSDLFYPDCLEDLAGLRLPGQAGAPGN